MKNKGHDMPNYFTPAKGFRKDIKKENYPTYKILQYEYCQSFELFVCYYLNLLIRKMDTVGKNGSRPQ